MTKKGSDIHIGHHAYKRERRVFLKQDHRTEHMMLLGVSGSGKTYFLEQMIRQDIEAGRGVCVLDPSGDLYKRLVNYCHINRFKHNLKDRLILINPQDEDWSIGLNYLEIMDAKTTPSTQAGIVSRGISKVFGDEDLEDKPRLDLWQTSTILPLIRAGLTLEDGLLFLTDSEARARILQRINDFYLIKQWERVAKLSSSRQDEYLEAVYNRFHKFLSSETTRRIIGQNKSTIKFREAIDKGAVILANLSEGGRVSPPEAKLLGVMLIDKLSEASKSRTDIAEAKRRRMYFYIDEFHKYLCEDIAVGLKELRKYGLSFVLASQDIAGIRETDYKTYIAIQQGATIKVCFAMTEEDAKLMIGELFPKYLADDKEKRRLYHTIFRPELGRAQVYTESEVEMESGGSGSGLADGSSFGMSSSISTAMGSMGLDSAIMIDGQSSGDSHVSSSSEFSASGTARGHGTADVPFYYLEEDQELAQIQDYTPEEKQRKVISKLVNLPKRHAFVKVRGEKYDAIPFITADIPVKKQEVLKSDFEKTLRIAHEKHAKLALDVDRLIETRRSLLLGRPVDIAEFQELKELSYNKQEVKEEDSFDQDTYEPRKD